MTWEPDKRTSKAIRDAFYGGWKAASKYQYPADLPEFRRGEFENWCKNQGVKEMDGS